MIILNASHSDKAPLNTIINTMENCSVKQYSSLIENPPSNTECYHFDTAKHAENCFELLKISKTSPNIRKLYADAVTTYVKEFDSEALDSNKNEPQDVTSEKEKSAEIESVD